MRWCSVLSSVNARRAGITNLSAYGSCIPLAGAPCQVLVCSITVLYAAGAFIFVGGYELIATEFTNERNLGKSKYRRAGLFLPVLAGFVLVALLQLVHGS